MSKNEENELKMKKMSLECPLPVGEKSRQSGSYEML